MTRRPGTLITKDPQSLAEPFVMDWTDWLAEIGASETILSSTWAVSGADAILTAASPSIVTGSRKTQIKLSAGTAGMRYFVTNTIVTSSSITDERSFFVLMGQR